MSRESLWSQECLMSEGGNQLTIVTAMSDTNIIMIINIIKTIHLTVNDF